MVSPVLPRPVVDPQPSACYHPASLCLEASMLWMRQTGCLRVFRNLWFCQISPPVTCPDSGHIPNVSRGSCSSSSSLFMFFLLLQPPRPAAPSSLSARTRWPASPRDGAVTGRRTVRTDPMSPQTSVSTAGNRTSWQHFLRLRSPELRWRRVFLFPRFPRSHLGTVEGFHWIPCRV